MLIQRLEIISFGKFKNKNIDFTNGLNVICGSNESGKSTVISFIYAMLYGFGDNRGKGLSLREKYTPWDGDACEGKILFKSKNNENITIYRKAGNAKKYDTLRIYNTDTGEELSISPEELVGASSDTFLKTLCIRQLSTVFYGTNDEIVTKLSNIADGGDETISYEKAIKLLENARREIQPQRGSNGSLSRITEEINMIEKKQYDHMRTKAELDSAKSLLPKAKENLVKIKNEYELALKTDYTASIAHLAGRIEEKSRNQKKDASPFFTVYTMIAAVCFAIFFILLAIDVKYAIPLLVLGVICFSGNFFIKKENTSSEDTLSGLQNEIESLKKQRTLHEEKLTILKNQLSSAEEALTNLNTRIHSLNLLLKDSDDTDLEKLYAERRNLEKRLSALSCALDALGRAHKKMQRDFTPALNKKAAQYFSTITDGKYTHLFCDEQFNLKIDSGIPRVSSYFSGGTVDQLYLSLRLALTDMLFKESHTCIILDQPFLQYDEMRKKNTVALLENMSKNRQTLLFTSDKASFSSNKKIEMLT